jgi:AraC-like DNA-binding protein
MSKKRHSPADEAHFVVRSTSSDMRGGAVIEAHSHRWHQLLYASAGLMMVWTESGSWVAPPSRGVWVPAGVRHSIRFVGESAFRTLYVRPDTGGELPGHCTSLVVSALLRELIVRAAEVGMLDRRAPAELAMATLIVSELQASSASPFTLPMPTSEALRQAAALMATASSTLPRLARSVGLGTRTFERRFLAETGLTAGRWRHQRLMLVALEALAAGAPVKVASVAAGYSGPSAFVAAFKETFGTTPARYFGKQERGPAAPGGRSPSAPPGFVAPS